MLKLGVNIDHVATLREALASCSDRIVTVPVPTIEALGVAEPGIDAEMIAMLLQIQTIILGLPTK